MLSTKLGRWSGRLLILAVVLFAVFIGLVANGQRGGETFFSNPALSGTILLAAVSTVMAGCAGVGAWRRDDRSLVVVVAIAAGALVALWVAAEIAFPH